MMDDFHTYDIKFNMNAMPLKIEGIREDIWNGNLKNFTSFLFFFFAKHEKRFQYYDCMKGRNVKKFLLSSKINISLLLRKILK